MSSGYVALTLSFEREDDQWVGECLELSTSAFSDSLEDCQAELRELVVAHLDVLEDVGERERSFEEWGIQVHPFDGVPPRPNFIVEIGGSQW